MGSLPAPGGTGILPVCSHGQDGHATTGIAGILHAMVRASYPTPPAVRPELGSPTYESGCNPREGRIRFESPLEVFPIEKKGRMTTLTGQWTAREATTKSVFERVGRQNDPYQARYLVASLFMMQTGIWHIDGAPEPYGSGYHFHLDPAAPSLCGSKFHCAESPSLALPLPEIRAGRRVLVPGEWAKLCEVCQRLLTHAPQPGDKVRVRVSGQTASIISVATPT